MRSKRAIYNITSNLILQFVTIIYGFIIPKIIITKFGSDVNGLVSSITQFLSYIVLLESGFGPVVKSILYKPIANKDNKTIENIMYASEKFFKRISYVFIGYIILLAFLYPLIVKTTFGFLFTSTLVLIISISIFAEYYFGMTYKLFLQSEQKNYIISIIQIVSYIICAILIVFLSLFDVSIHLIKLIGTLSFAIRPVFLNYYVKKQYKINTKNGSKNYNIKNKWDGLAQHIASVIHGNTDIAVLTFFCNIIEVSVYSTYYLVIRGVKLVIQAFCDGLDAIFGDMIAKKENDVLNEKFNMYEVFFFTITTIIFSTTFCLIIPFITIYTGDFKDANYIRPLFCFFALLAEYIGILRLPYLYLTYSAGHFKETKIGAWIECILNIVISIVAVSKLGLVGVSIGTMVAMTFRTCEFLYHANKYILNRNIWVSIKKVIVVVFETIIIIIISKYLPCFENLGYIEWFYNAIIVTILSIIITLIINSFFYIEELKGLVKIIKRNLLKRKK